MAKRIIEAWEERLPRLEPLCRMLLVADRFGVALLRNHCLHCLAARFEALAEERAPPREREVFEAFVAAVAPQVPVLACPHGADVLRCLGRSQHPLTHHVLHAAHAFEHVS